MKKILVAILVVCGIVAVSSMTAQAKTISVKSYYKPSTGRYVMPHYKTSPNKVKFDNYSAKGNYNPFTGKKGYSNW